MSLYGEWPAYVPARLQRRRRYQRALADIAVLAAIPLFLAVFSIAGPFRTDAAYIYSQLMFARSPQLVPGLPSIDPNFGYTANALGARSAFDVLAGHLPLWNHFEGLGSPLLGEMQSAALFPPTLLQALPHGQTIEQILLQFLAGAGAFLFFRTYGLGRCAALAGAVGFELNGVFAWLRNAVFNPVAFLPWFFLVIEALYVSVDRKWSQRLPIVCLGAVVSALALYAGFPEEVYLYGLLLLGWTVFRMVSLPGPRKFVFLADLALVGLIGLALSAPLLVAFGGFLQEADLGSHDRSGFYGIWINAGALIQYILPYIYGPIFGPTSPSATTLVWGFTGGYAGLAPSLFALCALFLPGRRAAKAFLAFWIVVALGASHGMPGVYPAFMSLPLTKIAACFRYLNASWIFCMFFLAALFIDDIEAVPRPRLMLIVAIAIGAASCLIALAMVAAWPLVSETWTSSTLGRTAIVGATGSAFILIVSVWVVTRYASPSRIAVALSGVMALEALVWFLCPYLSYPRGGGIDDELVAFLRENVGYQRVVGTLQAGIAANYGSYYGISLLNYNDLPAPRLTATYVKDKLDPYANSIIYIPQPVGLSPQQSEDRVQLFPKMLPSFAKAGVKFVMAGFDFNVVPAFDGGQDEDHLAPLAKGKSIRVNVRDATQAPVEIAAVRALIATPDGSATGHLKAKICSGAACAQGTVGLDGRPDPQDLPIPLDRPITIDSEAGYTIQIERLDGDGSVALPMFRSPTKSGAVVVSDGSAALRSGFAPKLGFEKAKVKLVYQGNVALVYELTDARDYMSAQSCSLTPVSRDVVDAMCERPSKLVRLELWMRGWSARVNGGSHPVDLFEGVFQSVDLPSGASHVAFAYEPAYFRLSLGAAGAALLAILAALATTLLGSVTSRRSDDGRWAASRSASLRH